MSAPEGGPGRFEVDRLTVTFGGVRALSEVSTVVPPGELVAVVGPNGAGKSTLLNAVSGLVRRQSSGAIRYGGKALHTMPAARRAVLGIGRSFQHPPLVERLTVLDNVLAGGFGGRDYGVLAQLARWGKVARSERAREEQARSYLDFLGLSELAGAPAQGIAYGQRKLVDIARALMGRPTLLLLDEPTSGLGRAEHAAMADVLRRLMERGGITILMVEHHMDLVRETATRVLGLQAGQVIADGPAREVLDSAEFRASLVGATATPPATRGETAQ
ncbi:ABC transporter ATP-binding protein [Dactylosporangium sp. CS-033363]|uniref:ABC transporter ATP-binding protein n=1 Tax=Dactylosporangium sp. CS-033363 TaxID=3239935 RepID=UPI003D8C84E2